MAATTNGTDTRNRVGVGYALERMPEEAQSALIKRALSDERALSGDVKKVLHRITGPMEVDGFRPGKAPLHRYAQYLTKIVADHGIVAGPLLLAWMDVEGDLRQRIEASLRERGIATDGDALTLDDDTIATFPRDAAWDDAMDALTAELPDVDPGHVRLMACLVRGALDLSEAEIAAADAAMTPDQVAAVFEPTLRALSEAFPDSPLWDYALNELPGVIEHMRQDRIELAERVKALVGIEQDLLDTHRELLEYFESTLEAELGDRATVWDNADSATAALQALHALLDDYAGVRDTAPTRSEEEARRVRRGEIEAAIDAAIDRVREVRVPVEEPEPAQPSEDAEAQREALQAAADAHAAERDALQAERDGLAAQLAAVTRERDDLRAERDATAEEAQGLRADLEESRNQAEAWRLSYNAMQRALAAPEGADAPARPTPDSVVEALGAAEAQFTDRLVVSLNSRSDTDFPFDKPQQVYDALEWLATVYRDAKAGTAPNPELDLSLRQDCGWTYTPHQSSVTMGQFREDYELEWNGHKRKLEEHIGTGNGHPRSTIRIAFLWDAPAQKVVVGFVGRHQRTRAT